MSGVKEYKLKKDIITPVETISAGTVFKFYNGTGDAEGYEYLVVEEIVEDFDEWFEEVSGRWRAEKGGEYFTVWHRGMVRTLPDLYTDGDYCNFNTGNYFKTEDEADDYRSYLLAKQRLKDSAGGYVPKRTDTPYGVLVKGNKLYIEVIPYTPGGIFFSSREVAEESLERYRDDWEFVIRYEAGEL